MRAGAWPCHCRPGRWPSARSRATPRCKRCRAGGTGGGCATRRPRCWRSRAWRSWRRAARCAGCGVRRARTTPPGAASWGRRSPRSNASAWRGGVALCLDGKTRRGTSPSGQPRGVHLLAAHLPDAGVVLAQVAVDGKAHAIVARRRAAGAAGPAGHGRDRGCAAGRGGAARRPPARTGAPRRFRHRAQPRHGAGRVAGRARTAGSLLTGYRGTRVAGRGRGGPRSSDSGAAPTSRAAGAARRSPMAAPACRRSTPTPPACSRSCAATGASK